VIEVVAKVMSSSLRHNAAGIDFHSTGTGFDRAYIGLNRTPASAESAPDPGGRDYFGREIALTLHRAPAIRRKHQIWPTW